jgi:type I restriction enzyme S subunit
MESKNGYKLTKVGTVPEDWVDITVGSLISERVIEKPLDGNHGNIHPKSTDFVDSGIPFVMANDIHDGRVDLVNCSFLRKKQADSLLKGFSKTGDVLLTHKATIGNTAIVGEIPFPYVMLTPQVTYYRVADKTRLNNVFLRYYFDSHGFQSVLRALAGGGTRAYIGISAQHQLPVVFPPTRAEQLAIAEALSDLDALLDSLDRLIAKKRDLKQAAMQQLLTGKTRLAGFDCEWKEKPLGKLFAFSGGYSASRDQLSTEGHCYLHYGDIHGSTKVAVDASADYEIIPKLEVSLSQVSSKSLLENGDVVFVDASEDDEGASRHVVIVNTEKIPFIAGLHTIVAKSKADELTHAYRRYCFQTAAIRQQFLFYAVGTKVTGISKTNIGRIKLTFPCVREQTAIAEVLIDMDGELLALQTRRKKTLDLKQAMMQELLTGKTRLV